ncbi:MAG: hypothetical protein IJX91_05380 [Clostridia bacterium]|nr:hypothetical protein [Clostridia bacterium]
MKKIRIITLSAVCALCAAAGVVVPKLQESLVSAETTSVSTFDVLDMASVRNAAPEGIRFFGRVEKAEKAALQNATFGILVYPTQDFGANGLTKETAADVLDIPAEYWLPEVGDEVNDETDKALYDKYGFDYDYSYFAAVVASEQDAFPSSSYTKSLTARGYVQIGDAPIEYTDTIATRSIAYVAHMALANGEADSNGLLAKVTNGVSAQATKASYELEKGNAEQIEVTYANVVLKKSDLITLSYESEDEAVASVDENGLITAVGGGVTNINVAVRMTTDNRRRKKNSIL